jgi:hypothetical protein
MVKSIKIKHHYLRIQTNLWIANNLQEMLYIDQSQNLKASFSMVFALCELELIFGVCISIITKA